jgi:hypothetical protein
VILDRLPDPREFVEEELPPVKQAFLDNFARTGKLYGSCELAGISNKTLDLWLVNPQFAIKFKEAKSKYLEKLESIADLRATKGVREPIVFQGRITGHTWKPSDQLLQFRLKKLDPSYRDSVQIDTSTHQYNIRIIKVASSVRDDTQSISLSSNAMPEVTQEATDPSQQATEVHQITEGGTP